MTKLPRVFGKDVVNALKRAGFKLSHIRGSHHYLRRPGSGLVSIPVLGLLAMVLAMVLVLVNGCAKAQKDNTGATRQQDSVQVTTREEKSEGKELKVEMKIPVISGMTDANIQSHLNAAFESSAMEAKKTIGDQVSEYVENASAGGYPVHQFQLISNYTVSQNKNGVLSITTETYQYTGGAHGMTVRKSYNSDLGSGQEITLKDLFKEGVNYKEIVNQEIHKQIAADTNKYFSADDMKFKTISDGQSFYIEGGDIVVHFSLYEIAPYAAGIPAFKIPLSLFGESVKTEFLRL